VQPVTVTVPVIALGVTGPQASATVAVPNAESMAVAVGLHAKVNVVPVAVITGAIVSTVQVIVLETDAAALPHASVAVQVRVCILVQPVTVTVPVIAVGVTGPHASATVA